MCAAGKVDHDFYRATVGRLVADHPDYFRTQPVYLADPFLFRGSAALESSDIPKIERVSPRRMTLGVEDLIENTHEISAENLSLWLDAELRSGQLRQRTIIAWTFGLFFKWHEQALEVEIRPPKPDPI